MSFSGLRDIFAGRVGVDNCVRSLLSLTSPSNVKEYLIGIHKVIFPDGDKTKNERWGVYPRTFSATPIKERHLSDPIFIYEQAQKLAFDISRFMEFLAGYTRVDDNIKPMMLHYGMIYLFDFFSRTWLKYERNWGHGIKLKPNGNEDFTTQLYKLQKSGIFPRAVDAFYFLGQSSLFSADDNDGIRNDQTGKIEKKKYSEYVEINFTQMIDTYEKFRRIERNISKSNPILVGYCILFILSSISRYRAEDWFKIREDRDLKHKIEMVQYDFVYEWTPEILMQTILKL